MNDVLEQQTALLDLNGQEISATFADEMTPVFIAKNPLHWKAHKLQIMLDRLETQMQRNPAQFNSTVYIRTLDTLTSLMEEINGQSGDKPILESGNVVDHVPEPSGSTALRPGESDGVDTGISADNPFARKRLSAA